MASNDKQFKVVYAISRKAYGMVKDGDANISSGGVRTKDGKLVELAVPTSYSIKNNVPQWNMPNSIFAPIAMASSLFNNIQSFLIQRSVNQANEKLNQISVEMRGISVLQDSLLELGKIQLGITVQNFKEIQEKLDKGISKIDKILEILNGQHINDIQEKFSRYCSNLKDDMELLTHSDHIEIYNTNIQDHLSNIISFLERILKEMEFDELSLDVGMPIVFKMIPGLIEVTKYFSAECCFQHGYIPEKLDDCIKLLDRLKDERFKFILKKYIFIEFLDSSTEQRYMLNSYIHGLIEWHRANLHNIRYLILQNKNHEYIANDVELMLEKNIRNGNNAISLNDELVGILIN